MPLTSGTRLGIYEVLGPLGPGGMGGIDRAPDTQPANVMRLVPTPIRKSWP